MKLALMVMIIAAVVSCSNAGAKFAGPFNLQIKQPFVCDDEGTQEFRYTNVTVRKKAKNLYTLSWTAFMKVPFDDGQSLRIITAVWGNGGWRPNFMAVKLKNACTTFSTALPKLFQQILDSNDLSGCPVPAGNYTLVDTDASPKVDWQSLPYNKYKSSIYLESQDGTTMGCFGMISEIVPKNKN